MTFLSRLCSSPAASRSVCSSHQRLRLIPQVASVGLHCTSKQTPTRTSVRFPNRPLTAKIAQMLLLSTALSLLIESGGADASQIRLERVALVVGNSAYPGNVLPNAGPDAASLATALDEVGFEVIYVREVNRAQFIAAVELFQEALKSATVGLFYFAGHAVQLRGRNYLLPLGTQITELSDIPREANDLELVLRALEGAPLATRLVFLDACRVNPFPRSFMSGLPATPDWVEGLAPPSSAPVSTLISFSTAPNTTASDGKTVNSPYTEALVRYIRQPGTTLEAILQGVRREVIANTEPDQVPWETGATKSSFLFRNASTIGVTITGGDDDVFVIVNDLPATSWSADRNESRTVALRPGHNTFAVDVYNQKTFTPGLIRRPEGWHYAVTLKLPTEPGSDQTSDVDLSGAEDVPADSGPRHGSRFRAVSGQLFVDPATGRVSVSSLSIKPIR